MMTAFAWGIWELLTLHCPIFNGQECLRGNSRKRVAATQAALVDHGWGICGEENHIVHQIIPRQSVQVAQVVLIRPHEPKLVLNLQ